MIKKQQHKHWTTTRKKHTLDPTIGSSIDCQRGNFTFNYIYGLAPKRGAFVSRSICYTRLYDMCLLRWDVFAWVNERVTTITTCCHACGSGAHKCNTIHTIRYMVYSILVHTYGCSYILCYLLYISWWLRSYFQNHHMYIFCFISELEFRAMQLLGCIRLYIVFSLYHMVLPSL